MYNYNEMIKMGFVTRDEKYGGFYEKNICFISRFSRRRVIY